MKEYKGLSEIDLKLRLLSRSSISVENLMIEPYTLEEIKEYGFSDYMENLQWISLSVDDFINSTKEESKVKILKEQRASLKSFDFYIKLGGQDLQNRLLISLSMIFKTDDVVVLDNGAIAIDFAKKGIIKEFNGQVYLDEAVLESFNENEISIVTRDNFDDIINVVRLQNFLSKPENIAEQQVNPADEETRLLIEHMKKMNEKVEDMKKKQQQQEEGDSEIDISDIISAVCSKSNSINKINIWEFTLYQLYDEYARLELIDNYDFAIKAMMAGAEKVDIRHWSSKL